MFGKKNSFSDCIVKTVMLKLSPICQRFDEKSCKIHVCSHSSSMPPFWIGFWCKNSLPASKTSFVYPLLGQHSPQTSGFSKIRFRGQGRSFQNKYVVLEGNSVRITKTTLQTKHWDKNNICYVLPRTDKWVKTLTTGPVPHSKTPFTSGKEQILSSPFLFLCTYFVPKSVFP